MIRKVMCKDLPECVDVIRKSFRTVAEEFGFNEENAPEFTAFSTTEERLYRQMNEEHRPMYVFCDDGKICGYYSLEMQGEGECELSNLAVLPAYRHQRIGKKLLDHAVKTAKDAGCITLNISIVEENKVLRKWYEKNGAVHIGTKKYDFFPFTCGYMKMKI